MDHGQPPVLEARALVAGYELDINILNGVSVKAFGGSIACVIGPNGTGKSTLLKTLFGLLKPVSGEVLFRQRNLIGLPAHQMIGEGITFLPQQPSIFPYLTVDVNLRLGLWHSRRTAVDRRARIERAYGQFDVLREKYREPAGQLSGGQQRQLEIARATLSDPVVFLIDEPSAGVDPLTSSEVYRMIDRLAHDEGKAVLLVDQDIRRALAVADYVYVMRNGSLFTEGPRREFGSDTAKLMSHWLGMTPSR